MSFVVTNDDVFLGGRMKHTEQDLRLLSSLAPELYESLNECVTEMMIYRNGLPTWQPAIEKGKALLLKISQQTTNGGRSESK